MANEIKVCTLCTLRKCTPEPGTNARKMETDEHQELIVGPFTSCNTWVKAHPLLSKLIAKEVSSPIVSKTTEFAELV